MDISYKGAIDKDLHTTVNHYISLVTLQNTTVHLLFTFRHQLKRLLRSVNSFIIMIIYPRTQDFGDPVTHTAIQSTQTMAVGVQKPNRAPSTHVRITLCSHKKRRLVFMWTNSTTLLPTCKHDMLVIPRQ